MKHYTFTDEQLFELLKSIPYRCEEYRDSPPDRAAAQAANDAIEALINEQEKVDAGETCFINQMYSKADDLIRAHQLVEEEQMLRALYRQVWDAGHKGDCCPSPCPIVSVETMRSKLCSILGIRRIARK